MPNTPLTKILFDNKNDAYADFCAKLTPGIERDKIIGVKVPVIRKIAKDFKDEKTIKDFLASLPHDYYDENVLHGSFISNIKDFDTCLNEIESFLPFVDNWAVCDMLNPKIFKKNPKLLFPHIKSWTKSKHTYTIRFGIRMLMVHFLGDLFSNEILEIPANIRSNEYYINMMLAWFFAEALIKKWDETIPYITSHQLDTFVQNKTIQKACESFRLKGTQKSYLRKFRAVNSTN